MPELWELVRLKPVCTLRPSEGYVLLEWRLVCTNNDIPNGFYEIRLAWTRRDPEDYEEALERGLLPHEWVEQELPREMAIA